MSTDTLAVLLSAASLAVAALALVISSRHDSRIERLEAERWPTPPATA